MSTKPQAPGIGVITLFTKGSSATGKQFNLAGSLVSFEIYEGLNQPNYSQQMNLTVLDPDNTLYKEITGNEIVIVGFKSALNKENENYVKPFQTIDAEKYIDDNQRQCVTIRCTTPYNVIGKLVYFSKVFDNISSKDCLEQVCSVIERGFSGNQVKCEYEKHFEDSLFQRPLNVPQRNWEWIIDYWVHNSVAQGSSTYSSLFYFWDDKNGLNFKSNKSLIQEDPKHILMLMKNSAQSLFQHGIIQRFEVEQQVDTKKQLKGKTVQPFVVNLNTSEFALGKSGNDEKMDSVTEQTYNFENDLIGQQNNRVFVPLNYATEWKLMGTQMNNTQIKTNVTNQIYEDTTYTTFAYAETPGDVMRCPGDIVQIVRIDRNGVIDKNDSTNWIIKSIKHQISYDKYIQVLELMK